MSNKPFKVKHGLTSDSNIDVTGNISITGTVDSRDIASDGSAQDSHIANTSNPHLVTKAQVSLGNVTNESKATMFTSATLTSVPTAPTAAPNTNSTQIATTAYVQKEVTDLIGGAVDTLDTLHELATAINNDASYASTLTTALATKLPKAGGTMTGNLSLGDNVKATFGDATGGDLQIYHDGSNSYINEVGTGNLYIKATNFTIADASGVQKLNAWGSGGVSLYTDGNVKLATTSTGIDITGTITCDSDVKIDGTDNLRYRIYNTGVFKGGIEVATTAGDMIASSAVDDLAIRSQGDIRFSSGGNSERLKVIDTGIDVTGSVRADKFQSGSSTRSISISESNGNDSTVIHSSPGDKLELRANSNTYNQLVLAENGNVGIYHTSPSEKLEVNGNIKATAFVGDGSALTGIVSIPTGLISMWSGAASAIPSGWNLCDGSNGTPNLVGKFIKGGSTAGATGGSTSTGEHTLTTAQMPSHSHYTLGGQTRPESGTVGTSKPAARAGTQSGSSYQSYVLRPATIDANVGPTNSQGGSSSHSHTVDPVHYTLCYIIKT